MATVHFLQVKEVEADAKSQAFRCPFFNNRRAVLSNALSVYSQAHLSKIPAADAGARRDLVVRDASIEIKACVAWTG